MSRPGCSDRGPPANRHEAYGTARDAYLDHFERAEIPLRLRKPNLVLDLEFEFAALRDGIHEGKSIGSLESTAAGIRSDLRSADLALSKPGFAAPLIAFLFSFSILFREGVEAFFEPFVWFCRYLPASAFIPLLILWAGIGETQKILVIFIGSVFQIVLMVAVTVGGARRDLVEAAYTLGAADRGIITRVLIPGAAPGIAETLRLVLGWAWTYVIVAELIGSSSGIGHMITDSQALLNTGQIIFGIIIIGLIGLVSDFAFKALNRRLFAWSSI